MDGVYNSKHGDDIKLLLHAWMGFKKAGGVGRAHTPPFANT